MLKYVQNNKYVLVLTYFMVMKQCCFIFVKTIILKYI